MRPGGGADTVEVLWGDAGPERPEPRTSDWLYALPFVVAHLVITVLVRLIKRGDLGQRRIVATVAGLTLVAVAVAVAVPWATLLSIKYDRPTFTTSAGYHVEVTSSGASGNAFGWAGILEPPNDFAVSAWEDPSLLPAEDEPGSRRRKDAGDGPGTNAGTGASDQSDDGAGPFEQAGDEDRSESTDVLSAIDNRVRRTIGSLRVAMPGRCLLNGCRYWGATHADSAAEVDRRLDANAIDTYITVKNDEAGSGCELLSDELIGRNVSVYDRDCPKAER